MATAARDLGADPRRLLPPAALPADDPPGAPEDEARAWFGRQLAWERRLERLREPEPYRPEKPQRRDRVAGLYTINTGQTT